MKLSAYLSGEIHSDWRKQLKQGIEENNLDVELLAPVTDHGASDGVGRKILGQEDSSFWKDHKSAKINHIRVRTLIGKADVVEFHGEVPYPVEYKSGPRRQWGHDDLQLCAQAMCLEEMTGKAVSRGAIYHHKSHRRREVVFDDNLRGQVAQAVASIRAMLNDQVLPPPVNDKRCDHCSLKESCMPGVIEEKRRAKTVLANLFSVTDK